MDNSINLNSIRVMDSKQPISIEIDESSCNQCGNCVMVCPHAILVQKCEFSIPIIHLENDCISCGHCIAICPNGAISHSDYWGDRIKHIDNEKPLPDQLMTFLKSRRSIRVFQEKKVDKELMELIIEAACSAPSASNSNNVEYVIVQDSQRINELVGILGTFYGKLLFLLDNPQLLEDMSEGEKMKILSLNSIKTTLQRIVNRIGMRNDILQRGSPTLMVFHGPISPVDFPMINSALALQNTSLFCSSLGLGSCQLGYIELAVKKMPEIKNLLGIDENHEIYGLLAIGYPKYSFDKYIEKTPASVEWI